MTSQEMDALIAEKVMGLTVRWAALRDGKGFRQPPMALLTSKGEGDSILPRYSTEIADAMAVVEKISFRSDATAGRFMLQCWGWLGECWEAGWYDQPKGDVKGKGETAPLAICRAALQAVGVDIH